MGLEYTATLVIGIELSREDLFDVKEKLVNNNCEHGPFPAGVNFCPTCGQKNKPLIKTTYYALKESPLKAVLTELDMWWPKPQDDEKHLLDLTADEPLELGVMLQLGRWICSDAGADDEFFLGIQLGSVDVTHDSTFEFAGEEICDSFNLVLSGLSLLGYTREPKLIIKSQVF